MIDIETEDMIPLNKASKYIPGRPHLSCLYRWMADPDNPLETLKIGGRRWTSKQAIARWIARANPQSAPAVAPQSPLSAAEKRARDKRQRRVDDYLDSQGI